ncbi:uncharacterized protein BO97DRAFT_177310 [Aspergillus homomorphus CBS 101889]|uniref:Ubiquitin 3 binding protein But2 C-terminal domain-containing protein n=1 Tax=Aspergillus homomorphus (strain CBS 101889) TaxID=1450537 RepID=A0A395I733_ASPHC|nr:hypothetical protein BO97DRAFT_177310 [Aspergillus homomorphus CBS 101889]RAL15907.1 hypothetical protein BO97DRAFT_177310 [Aspergillus homomorphus CBS 101889]
MFFRHALVATTAFLSVSTALPAVEHSPSSHLLSLRDDTQCGPRSAYYVCYLNHFRGCCSVDPCALEAGCPDNNHHSHPNDHSFNLSAAEEVRPVCSPSGTQIFQPQMEIIFPTDPAVDSITTANLNLSRSATTQWNQLMSFNLPSEARQCTIGWTIPARRNFTAGSNALVRVIEHLAPGNSTRIGAADFSFWPDTPGPHEALVGTTACKEHLQFQLILEHRDTVFMEQNERTGWWVRYTC